MVYVLHQLFDILLLNQINICITCCRFVLPRPIKKFSGLTLKINHKLKTEICLFLLSIDKIFLNEHIQFYLIIVIQSLKLFLMKTSLNINQISLLMMVLIIPLQVHYMDQLARKNKLAELHHVCLTSNKNDIHAIIAASRVDVCSNLIATCSCVSVFRPR